MSRQDALIGVWRLVSYQAQDVDGKISYPLGKNLLGLLYYVRQGFMSVQVMRSHRPKYGSDDLQFSSVEETAAAGSGYIAYAGRFSGAAPIRPGSIRFANAQRAPPISRPSPMLFRVVDLDRQTSEERHQEIHRQTKCRRWCPVCKKTSQIRVAQNDSVQRPCVGAND
jgi:Lipocalin-like domain